MRHRPVIGVGCVGDAQNEWWQAQLVTDVASGSEVSEAVLSEFEGGCLRLVVTEEVLIPPRDHGPVRHDPPDRP